MSSVDSFGNHVSVHIHDLFEFGSGFIQFINLPPQGCDLCDHLFPVFRNYTFLIDALVKMRNEAARDTYSIKYFLFSYDLPL